MLIGAVYRSLNSYIVNFAIGHLRMFSYEFTYNNYILLFHMCRYLVHGDFNMPLIDWNSWTVASKSSVNAEFLDFINDLFTYISALGGLACVYYASIIFSIIGTGLTGKLKELCQHNR